MLFARKGLRLEEYCIENRIPYIPFATFADIEREIRKIIRDDQRNTRGHGRQVRYKPKANFWRQVNKVAFLTQSHFGKYLFLMSNRRSLKSTDRFHPAKILSIFPRLYLHLHLHPLPLHLSISLALFQTKGCKGFVRFHSRLLGVCFDNFPFLLAFDSAFGAKASQWEYQLGM